MKSWSWCAAGIGKAGKNIQFGCDFDETREVAMPPVPFANDRI